MYAAGPKLPGIYMTPSVMSQIISAMEDIKQELVLAGRTHECARVSYNLVGGEPTLDMDSFATCVQYAAFKDLELEMTTNGWWLRSAETTAQFLRAVRPWYLKFNDGSIRISDSAYHRSFRTPEEIRVLAWPGWKRATSSEDVWDLMECLKYGDGPVDSVACPECEAQVAEDDFDDHTQNGCSVSFDTLRELLLEAQDRHRESYLSELLQNQLAGMLSGRDLSIYVDQQGTEADQISPVGRARANHITATQDGPCGKHENELKFTFQPDGSIYDFCCSGGKIAGGHARDGSQLLYNHLDFMSLLFERYPVRDDPSRFGWNNPWQGARCRGCSHVAREWREREDKILHELKTAPKPKPRKLQPA